MARQNHELHDMLQFIIDMLQLKRCAGRGTGSGYIVVADTAISIIAMLHGAYRETMVVVSGNDLIIGPYTYELTAPTFKPTTNLILFSLLAEFRRWAGDTVTSDTVRIGEWVFRVIVNDTDDVPNMTIARQYKFERIGQPSTYIEEQV